MKAKIKINVTKATMSAILALSPISDVTGHTGLGDAADGPSSSQVDIDPLSLLQDTNVLNAFIYHIVASSGFQVQGITLDRGLAVLLVPAPELGEGSGRRLQLHGGSMSNTHMSRSETPNQLKQTQEVKARFNIGKHKRRSEGGGLIYQGHRTESGAEL